MVSAPALKVPVVFCVQVNAVPDTLTIEPAATVVRTCAMTMTVALTDGVNEAKS